MIRLFKKATQTETSSRSEFYLPAKETIRALSDGKALTEEQIKDYIQYIKRNYFVAKINVPNIDQFAVEYVLFSNDENRFQARLEKAKAGINKSLARGCVPDIVDALWFSSKVFVDDENTLSRRIITKVVVDEKLELDVQTARLDAGVAKRVSNLKGELKELISSSKSVDITR